MKSVADLICILTQGVKKGAQEFAEVAKEAKFEVRIINDGNGIGMSCTMGWDPLKEEKEEDYQTVEEIHDEPTNIEELERQSILRAMDKNKGNKKAAAASLGISLRTLNRKLKEYETKK